MSWEQAQGWLSEHRFLWSAVLAALTLAIAATAYGITVRVLGRWAHRTDSPVDDAMIRHLHSPLRWLLPIASLALVAPLVSIPDAVLGPARHALMIVVIGLLAWLLMRILRVVQDSLQAKFDLGTADNLQARAVYTRVRGFSNIAKFLIGLLAVAFILMTFERVRELGVSLLASAGLAGVVVGFAAQRSLATVIAGIQVALAQPIRVNDVVIVEGEWGRIEEITLTYVVVRAWDLRRLVVPISHFIEKPFQNWTRVSPELLGTVFVYTDYRIPVAEVRAELERILGHSDLWDGKAQGLQVTNTTDRTLELRALVSAADSGKLWDLRCLVREKLIGFIQERYPECLPRHRAAVEPASAAAGMARAGTEGAREPLVPGPDGAQA